MLILFEYMSVRYHSLILSVKSSDRVWPSGGSNYKWVTKIAGSWVAI
jgi:hypothetical protein